MTDCVCDFVGGGGFGVMPFGTGPFGTEVADALALVGGNRAITANQVLVPFEGDVGLPNPSNPDSPLSPSAWTLVPLEPEAVFRYVQSVVLVTDETLPTLVGDLPQLALGPLPAFLASFDGPLTEGALYRLELAVAGTAISSCDCAEFSAVLVRRDARATDARDGTDFLRDIANPLLARDALRFPPQLGTYQITDTGDLGLDRTAESSLRKRIERRVTAATGAFFHLPAYGTALELKKLLTIDRVQRLQSRIRAQVLLEPEVTAALVQVIRVQGSPSTVSVSIRVRTSTGEPLGIVVPIQLP